MVFISGNMPMRTEIAPLLIMTRLEQFDYAGAAALAMVLLGASFVLLARDQPAPGVDPRAHGARVSRAACDARARRRPTRRPRRRAARAPARASRPRRRRAPPPAPRRPRTRPPSGGRSSRWRSLFLAAFVLVPAAAVVGRGAPRRRRASGGRRSSDADALAAVRLTLLVAAIAVPLNALFGLAAAWSITRFRYPGRASSSRSSTCPSASRR